MTSKKKELEIIEGIDQLIRDQKKRDETTILPFGEFFRERRGIIHEDHYFAAVYKALGFPFKRPELFPAFRFRKEEGRVLCLNLFPRLSVSKEKFLGKTFFIDLEHHQLIKVLGVEVSKTRKQIVEVRGNHILFEYQIIEFKVEELETPEDGKETVLFLFHNREVNFLIHEMVKNLHYTLGFPPKHFDNLGLFWRNHYGDLKIAFLKAL